MRNTLDTLITKSFKRLLDKGIHRGFITYEELTKSLGKRHHNQENIEKAFLHGHSFTGNPIGCAVSLASLDLLEKKTCQNKITEISKSHKEFITRIRNHKKINDIRHSGTILAIELKDEQAGYQSSLRSTLYKHFLNEGVLMRPLGNVMYLMPPYCITKKELEKVYCAIEKACDL